MSPSFSDPWRRARGRSRPRLTGLSVLVAGVSWDWTESERDFVRQMIIALEDRRMLYYAYPEHVPEKYMPHVVASVLETREFMTEALWHLRDTKSALLVEDMRAACRDFLDNVGPDPDDSREFGESLGELRTVFGINLGILVERFDLEIRGQLAEIIPPSTPPELSSA